MYSFARICTKFGMRHPYTLQMVMRGFSESCSSPRARAQRARCSQPKPSRRGVLAIIRYPPHAKSTILYWYAGLRPLSVGQVWVGDALNCTSQQTSNRSKNRCDSDGEQRNKWSAFGVCLLKDERSRIRASCEPRVAKLSTVHCSSCFEIYYFKSCSFSFAILL